MKKVFAYGTITLFGWLFQNHLTNQFFSFYTPFPHCCGNDRFFQPRTNSFRQRRIKFIRFRLFPFRSPLLGEYYHNIIHESDYPDPWIIKWFFFSFPPGTEMFYFPGFTSSSLTEEDMTTLLAIGFPIRTSPDQSFLAAPRRFSQPDTSFFGNLNQGIHCLR